MTIQARVRAAMLAGLLASLVLGAGPARAQGAADPFNLTGPDRQQRLLEGARKEGVVNLYTSMNEKDVRALAAAFEKKYGIKAVVWRSGKNKVLQRTLAEAQAGRAEVDVVHNPAPEMEALRQEKQLRPVRSPYVADLIQGTVPAHGEWVPLRVYVFVQAYNTQAVKPDEVPKRWEDLLDARWKGRLGIEAKEQEWFATLAGVQGEAHTFGFFRDLTARNGLSVRSGNSLLLNMVISGEVPFALTMYSYLADQAKLKGAPIDYVALKPTVAYTDGVGIMQKAPHPYAAMLFYDFLLSDGEVMMKAQKQLTAHRRDEAQVAVFAPVYIDPTRVLVDYDKWTQAYEDAIQGRGLAPGTAPRAPVADLRKP
ncbi:MAG: extracellular solute-binding protein [Casimicrobiaceae bacterium]